MPVTLTFQGTATEIHSEMLAMLGRSVEALNSVGTEPLQPEKPKATRSTKAKTEDAKPATAEAGEPEQGSGKDETPSTSTTATTDASPSEPVTEASLRARATAYAAKGGPAALVEMQKLAGAPNGKMSEVVASTDAMTKLDALLADAGF
jgi:hypothetical protein